MPLDIRVLRDVRTIISHGVGCPDGLASAIILRDILTEAKVVFMNYNTPEHRECPAEPGQLFVDFSPPRERAKEFVDAGAIVLDHHKYAKDIVDMFGDRGVFADEEKEPGVSGAVLAYREVWRPLANLRDPKNRTMDDFLRAGIPQDSAIRHFAKLAGIRDTWQKNHPSWRNACAQAEVLKFYPPDIWLSRPSFDPEWIDEKMQLGEILLQKKDEFVKAILKKAVRHVTSRNIRLLIVPTKDTSDIAEAMTDADVLVGFGYNAEPSEDGDYKISLELSLRSRGGYDVGAFCKKHGGGGHKAAAGCKLEVGDDSVDPYTEIIAAFQLYENPPF